MLKPNVDTNIAMIAIVIANVDADVDMVQCLPTRPYRQQPDPLQKTRTVPGILQP